MKKLANSGDALKKQIDNTHIPPGSIAFWNLGQAGILFKGNDGDGLICIDPYLTKSIEEANPETEFKRAFDPPLTPSMLKGVSGVLATHEHDDHLDIGTITGIAEVSAETKFVAPAPIVSLLKKAGIENYFSARQGEPFFIEGFRITPVAAAHAEYEKDSNGDHNYLGYLLEVNGVRLFHSGDTLVTNDLLEKVKEFKPDIVFLPINGGDYFRTARNIIGNMSFREATDFAVAVGADLVVPIHFDLFPNNRDNPAYFVDYLFHHYPGQKFHMMVPGERFIYFK